MPGGGFTTFLNNYPPTRPRGLMWLALGGTALIQAVSYVSDTGGGGTATWQTVGTTECRLDPAGFGAGRLRGGRIDERSTHIVTVPIDAVVSSENRFVIGARGTFEITAAHMRDDARLQRFEVIQI